MNSGTFTSEDEIVKKLQNNPGCYIPKRYILAIMGFFGMCNVYAMRVNLSVAIVAMVNNTDDSSMYNMTHGEVECAMLQPDGEEESKITFKGEQYQWDSRTQGMILGAFFYGYMITQIPGGYLAERFGAKWFFGGGIFLTSILTLLTPLSARMGTAVLVAIRVLEGIGEGVTLPSITVIISRWSPLLERSRISAIIFTGTQTGNVVSLILSGYLSSTDLLGGWPSAFYVFGAIGCIWFVFWAFLVYESPYVHPSISKEELAYFNVGGRNESQTKQPVPWKSIFTSLPVWATLVAHCGYNFGFLVYLTNLPNYLHSVLHFNILKNGVLSALPFIVEAIVSCFASYIADKMRSSGRLSITWIRKIMNTIGLGGPGICLLFVTISGCSQELVVFLMTLAMAFNGFVYSGFNITHVDMSPDYSGILYGITCTVSNLSGVIAPAIVGAVTSDGATIPSWNKVFYITSATYFVGAIFYLLFSSAELQPWAKGLKKEEENKDSLQKQELRIGTNINVSL